MRKITEYFEEIETVREYDGYYHSISEAITIVILGSMCGLKNVCQIHQWSASAKVSEFLREEFAIERIPCYYWLLCLLKLIKPESLNKCFVKWIEDIRKESGKCPTISFDGKTVRSTKDLRTCPHSPKCSDCAGIAKQFLANFPQNEEFFCRRTVCTSRKNDEVMRKICRKTSVERLCGQVLMFRPRRR